MISVDFTDEQLARLRAALGLRPGDPDPTAGDLLLTIEAQQLVDAEGRRWDGLGRPRDA